MKTHKQRPVIDEFTGLEGRYQLAQSVILGLYFVVLGFSIVATAFQFNRVLDQFRLDSQEQVDILSRHIEKELSDSAVAFDRLKLQLTRNLYLNNTIDISDISSLADEAFNRDQALYQIRLIEKSGQERVRIQRGKGPQPLQVKPGRPYLNVASFDNEQRLLSPINLNVEEGILERPLRPTYRISAPMNLPTPFDELVLVLNFDTQNLFSILREQKDDALYIARANGEWLVHPDADRQFTSQTGLVGSLQVEFPSLLLDQAEGFQRIDRFNYVFFEQIRLNNEHWFIRPEYQTIYLLKVATPRQLISDLLTLIATLSLPMVILATALFLVSRRLVFSMKRRAKLADIIRKERNELTEKNNDLTITYRNLCLVQENLVESQKVASLGMMVAGIAHELNTPVNGAHFSADQLCEDLPDLLTAYQAGTLTEDKLVDTLTRSEEGARLITSQLDACQNLIARFKLLARSVRTEEAYTHELSAELHSLQRTLETQYAHRGIDILLECPEDLSVFTHGFLLNQVITNLIENAYSHAFDETDTGRIAVRVTQYAAIVRIVISDNGKGIADSGRIFEPFFTSARGSGHTGLGLHMVFLWVTQILKGRIAVNSEPQQGTDFEILLPLDIRRIEKPLSETAIDDIDSQDTRKLSEV